MPTARPDTASPGSGTGRKVWLGRLGLVLLILLIVVALVAMEVFSLLLLDLFR